MNTTSNGIITTARLIFQSFLQCMHFHIAYYFIVFVLLLLCSSQRLSAHLGPLPHWPTSNTTVSLPRHRHLRVRPAQSSAAVQRLMVLASWNTILFSVKKARLCSSHIYSRKQSKIPLRSYLQLQMMVTSQLNHTTELYCIVLSKHRITSYYICAVSLTARDLRRVCAICI